MVPKDETDSPRFRASQAAHDHSQHFSQLSKLEVVKERLHPVGWDDVKKHQLLGKGAFSEVYRVEVNTPEMKGKRCALKYLRPNITDIAEGDFDLAAIDLATEAHLLSRLDHDNIIELHGIYGGDLESAYVDSEKGYFLLLDQLRDTLPKHLERARAKERRRILSNSVSNEKMLERLKSIALGIAKGLEYLHSNEIIFRDLKPDNVGFTQDGNPVIFDFGFARELHTLNGDEIAGSLRYMSPEMAFGRDPSLPSDVYSMGVLLYELCTLQKPFKQFKDRTEFTENVLVANYRPSLATISSKSIQNLIADCWSPDQEKRPEMSSVVKILRVETALSLTRTMGSSNTPGSLAAGLDRNMSMGMIRRSSMNGSTNSLMRRGSIGGSTNNMMRRGSVAGSTNNMMRRSSVNGLMRASPSTNSIRQNASFFRRPSMQAGIFDSELSLAEMSVTNDQKGDAFSSTHNSNWTDMSTLGTLRKPFKMLSRPKPCGQERPES